MSEEFEQRNVLYQADNESVKNVHALREKLHVVVKKYMFKYVRITSIDGHVFEGTIVHVERGAIYLCVYQGSPGFPGYRQPFGYGYNPYFYNNVILPLVLYELLTITLLYS